MDYKDTLILPKTDFPMRANLPINESLRYEKWKKNKVYEKMKNNRTQAFDNSQLFSLHDGPPYANGHLHIGHALNKILKDIIVKYHYFQGKSVRYTPGWDCHGLPIEQQIEKKLGKEKKDALPKQKIRELCRAHANEFISIQSREFEQLGVLGDFDNPYKTMDFAFENQIYKVLCKVASSQLLTERSKPIYWSWACETALADAEVEYKDKESDSVFVAFSLNFTSLTKLDIPQAKFVIWTTTPWTLPSNSGIALKPFEIYILTQKGYIVAKKLHPSLVKDQVVDEVIIKEFSAEDLDGLVALNPLNGRDSRIVLGEYVSMADGSGAVHISPAHGEEDYYIGLKYNLPILMAVDDKGCFDELILREKLLPAEFVGTQIFKAQDKIIEMLGTSLLKHTKIVHSYPHCWRSHEPVIYRATTQWFILMDKPFKNGKTLRQIALEAIDKTSFYPKSGRNRLRTMVENRPDWCISRQRDWGVPIAFFRDKASGEVIFEPEVLEHLTRIFQEEGCDAWWNREIVELLPPSWAVKASDLEKGKHILDVWFDSGSTWSATLHTGNDSPKYDAGNYPADLYLEGSDQHRGWFQSSLLLSCILNAQAPFKTIITHGFTVDENGEKMSKSKGNVIGLDKILKEYGSEILRLWVVMNDYQNDLTVSLNFFKQIGEQYRKIRNTLRFLLANADGLESLVGYGELSQIDRYFVTRADEIFTEVERFFGEYEFVKAMSILMGFLTNELSGIYLDLCKDSLYCDERGFALRLAHQSAIAVIGRNLLHLLAPILTYSVDEALDFAPKIIRGEAKDVFDLEKFNFRAIFDLKVDINFNELLAVRSKFGEVIDSLKKDKIIKSSLELCVGIENGEVFSDLDIWLIVSEVFEMKNLSKDHTSPLKSFQIFFEGRERTFSIFKTTKYKCPRCWRYICDGDMKESGEEILCQRCTEVIKQRVQKTL